MISRSAVVPPCLAVTTQVSAWDYVCHKSEAQCLPRKRASETWPLRQHFRRQSVEGIHDLDPLHLLTVLQILGEENTTVPFSAQPRGSASPRS